MQNADTRLTTLLYLNVFVVATCGLVYELVAGALASYVLGDSVTQFSLVIGVYLSAMGIGAWLSGLIKSNPARAFIEVELAVALLGGFSAPLLFVCFTMTDAFRPMLFGIVFGIGVLVGLELPLLMRILKEKVGFESLVSRALAFDYIGALIGSLMFPLILMPILGLSRSSLVLGLLNGLVGLWGTWLLKPMLGRDWIFVRLRGVIVVVALGLGLAFSQRFTQFIDERLYDDPILYSQRSDYQQIVVTGYGDDFRLFLDGRLQFYSKDEYRYHESLVHPAMSAAKKRGRVLILGGGDGLALREVLRYDDVESVVLVDLDPAMTGLSLQFEALAQLNANAFDDPRVKVVNADAMKWLEDRPRENRFDLVIVDFPDPNNYSLAKLYTRYFYRLVRRHIEPQGLISVQSTSPHFARRSFWCIANTIAAADFRTRPYHITVPSFGVWGFVLASPAEFDAPSEVRGGLRYLNDHVLAGCFRFPNDLARVEADINRLDNQILVHYYESE